MVLATLPACSGGSSDPPTAPPTATSITINLRDVVLAGISVVATATAALSNGQTQAITTGWRSDAPAVATITDAGNLTPLANGEVTITVTALGTQATKRIRVAPNYDGRWQGVQVVAACNATGIFAGFCEDNAEVIGASFPISLTARHPGELAVSGEFNIEDLAFPTFSTQVESDGRIRFSSVATFDEIRADVSWNITASEVGRASGTIRERYSAAALVGAGEVVIDSNLAAFVRSGADADRSISSGSRGMRLRAFLGKR
jgi:hypothetical protein